MPVIHSTLGRSGVHKATPTSQSPRLQVESMRVSVGALIGLACVVAAQGLTTEVSPTAPPDPARAVATSVDAFGIALYQEVRSTPGNLVVSPLSLAAVLWLVLVGARGATETQLASALRITDVPTAAEGYRQIMGALQANDEDVLLRMANKMYLQTGFDVKENFQQTAVDVLRSGVEELNFQQDAANAVNVINKWVEDFTEGKIANLLQPDMVGPDTVMILINAIYFRAAWNNVFHVQATSQMPFYITESQQVDVAMMTGTFQLEYADVPELNAAALKLPYKSSNIQSEMIVVLPNEENGMEELESNLEQLQLQNIAFSTQRVHVYLPRFKIETTILLNDILQEMGIVDLFSSQANLSGISDTDLHVSTVLQKAYISVKENGTEAAAATAVVITESATVEDEVIPKEFKADHQFLFFLRVGETTLFMGRVAEPQE